MNPAFTRTLYLPTIYTRASEHQWGHRQGQEVGRAERAEKEERLARPTSCPQDTRPTLWPGHRPLPPNDAQPQAGQAVGAPEVRLLYRSYRYASRRPWDDQQQ